MSAIASGDLCYGIGRSVVYVGGYFYAFYYRTTDGYLCYRSSPDGVNWSSEVALWAIGGNDGYAVYTDGTYIYVAYGTPTYSTYIRTASTAYTVRGTPSAGTITWASAITVRQAGGWWLFSWAKTTNRFYLALIAYYTTSTGYHVHVYYNSDGNSAWTEILDSTTLSDGGYRAGICICDLPQYTDGIMLVAAKYSASTLTYKVYDGSAWVADTSFGSKAESIHLYEISMAAMSGQVHLTVIPSFSGGALSYYYYTTSWSSATTVESSTCVRQCLSATSSKLYVFYNVSTDILYRTMDYSTHTWSSATTLASNQASPNMVNTERYPSGKIGVLWRQGSALPYSIMFSYVTLAVAYTVSLTESLGLKDSTVKASSVTKRELLGLSDVYGRTWAAHRTYTEPLGLLDVVVKNVSVAKAESLGLSDVVSSVRLFYQTLTELLGLSDVVVKAPSVVRAESLGLLDSYSRIWSVHRTYSENLGLADYVQKSPSTVKSELLGLSDVVRKSSSILKSELLGLSDFYSRTWTAYRTYTESLGLSDKVSKTTAVPLSETLGLFDTVIKSSFTTKVESLGLADFTTKGTSVAKTERLGLSDVMRKAPGKTFSEALGLKDTYSRVFAVHRTFTEPLGLKDTVSKGVALHALVEVLGLYDRVVYAPNVTVLAKLIRKYMQLVNLGGEWNE
jgi:hypothetical protein